MSDPEFIAQIRAFQQTDLNGDPILDENGNPIKKFDFTDDTPIEVADKIANADDVKISVGFYSKWLTRAIAYEEDGAVYFNTRKESYGAGSPGNVAHEVCHAMGWSHNGNAAAGNENTVPYWIGNQVDQWIADGKLKEST